MTTLQDKIKTLFESTVREVTIKPNVKKDPKTANLSGQAKMAPGDIEAAEKMKNGSIVTDDIIEKINAIRAGHSLKDPNIATALEKYVSELDIAEKTALFAYLKGIAEIVSQQSQGPDAVEPSDPEPAVDMEKQNIQSKAHKTIQPQIKQPRGGGGESIDAPKKLPITPKMK